MGLQDRDYYKDDTASGYVTSVTVKLIIINCALFLADLLFGGPQHRITLSLAQQGNAVAQPWLWYQFLTAGFVHDWSNLWHLGGNMLGLYFFGKPLEERFGWKEFLRFYLLAIVFGSIVWGVRTFFFVGPHVVPIGGREVPIWNFALGASGGVTACVILFALLYPRATLLVFFAIPAPAWLVGVLIVASDMFAVQLPGQQGNVAHDIHLAGAAFALAYWYFGWNFGRLPGMAGLSKAARSLGKSLKPKPDLRVHDPETYYDDLDAEADRVLDKLHHQGEASLSARERRILEDYSRRMRQKHR